MALPSVCKFRNMASGPNGIGLNFGAFPNEFDTWSEMFLHGESHNLWLSQYDEAPANFVLIANDPDRSGMYHRRFGEWVCIDATCLNAHYRLVNTLPAITYSTAPVIMTNNAGAGSAGFPSVMYDPLRTNSLDIYDVTTSSFDVSKLKEGDLFRVDLALVITPQQLGQEVTFTLRWGGEDANQSHYITNKGAGESVNMYLSFLVPLVEQETSSLTDRISMLVSCDAGYGKVSVTDMTIKVTKRRY